MRYTVDNVPTPAVVVDLAVVRRNIAKMAGYCREKGVKLRPHFKTHKTARMAEMQMAAGACGMTVAKVGEAELVGKVAEDLMLAYPALDEERAGRLAKLAGEVTVRVAVDSKLAVERLGAAAAAAGTTVGILVEIDVGFHRVGVQTAAEARALAEVVSKTKGARLDGIMFYPGQIRVPAAEQLGMLAEVEGKLGETMEAFRKAGLSTEIVSGGSTPTAYQSHLIRGMTEIRPGTYIYNDLNTLLNGWCGAEEVAAKVVCTVVSDAVPGKVVVDAGSKVFSSDGLKAPGDTKGFGAVADDWSLRVTRMSEEHGEIEVAGAARRPRLGERLAVIPNHICACVNLQNAVWVKGEDGVLERWAVDGRGLVV